eukprot:scaffold172448_cov43-Prasinocladus_malaysianus.AAC.1
MRTPAWDEGKRGAARQKGSSKNGVCELYELSWYAQSHITVVYSYRRTLACNKGDIRTTVTSVQRAIFYIPFVVSSYQDHPQLDIALLRIGFGLTRPQRPLDKRKFERFTRQRPLALRTSTCKGEQRRTNTLRSPTPQVVSCDRRVNLAVV